MTQTPTTASPQSPAPSGSMTLVVIAIVLALLAVVLVNIYVANERDDLAGNKIAIYHLNESVKAGDKLAHKQVERHLIPKEYADEFDQAVSKEKIDEKIAEGARFARPVQNGRLLKYEHFITDEGTGLPSVSKGMRLVALPVDSRTAPGALKPGVTVDIEAPFNVGGRIPMVYPVMEYVRVRAVGRRTVEDQREGGGRRTVRSFRTISIEVEPWQANHLSMIEKLAVGEFVLHIRGVTDTDKYPKTKTPGINSQVIKLIEAALGRPLPGHRR